MSIGPGTLGLELKSQTFDVKREAIKLIGEPTKKATVGLPIKIKLEKGQKTGIISIFTGISRRDRRVHARNRVRESSPETFHPANKDFRKEQYNKKRNINLLKTMSTKVFNEYLTKI